MVTKRENRGAPCLRPCFLLLILAFAFSCAGLSPREEQRTARLIEGVPFYPQEAYQCGPSSLAGVLNYWGVRVSPEEIASEIYSASAKGTLTIDMVLYAAQKGLETNRTAGSLEDIRKNVDKGYPVIVLVDYGLWVLYHQYHFMVVLGYDENGVIVNSGRDRHKFIEWDGFLKTWKKAEFWALVVTPR